MKSKTAELLHMLNCWVWNLCESGVHPRQIAQAFDVPVYVIEVMSANYVNHALHSKLDAAELEYIARGMTCASRPIVKQRIATLQSIVDAEVQT